MPHVSVCIPTYNYARFLGDAIESVLVQTYRDFELVVFDNGSSDDTPQLMQEYLQKHPGIRYVRRESPLPITLSFNCALGLATGDLVKILCADDWLAPEALEACVSALARHPRAALAATARVLVGESGDPVGVERYADKARLIEGTAAIDRCLFGTNYIGEPSAVLFRRRLAAGGFDERYPHLFDMEFWFRLLEQGALAFLPQPLAMVRHHPAQTGRDNARAGFIVEDRMRVYAHYRGKPYVRRTWAKALRWRLDSAYSLWHGTGAVGFFPRAVFLAVLPVLNRLGTARVRRSYRRARRLPHPPYRPQPPYRSKPGGGGIRAPLMDRIVYPIDWQMVGLQPQILVRATEDQPPQEVRLAAFDGHGTERTPARTRVALEPGTRWLEGRVAAPLEEGRYILCLDDGRAGRPVHTIGIHARASADQWVAAFERMLRARLAHARPQPGRAGQAPLFSVTTTVYDTDPLFFDALADCLRGQTFGDFEWLVLDNGSTRAATIEAMAQAAARDPRVRLFRVEQNLHIIGGNRYLLERARGRFIVPVDSDDLVYPDALGVLARHCVRADAAAVYFSDEQKVDPFGAPAELIWRPAWSELFARATCPAAHLMVYDREKGLAAGAYTEDYARGSHDWDTMLRLVDAGAKPVRISEVLYGWRMHPQSAAATEDAKEYTRASQTAVLEHSLERRGLASRFSLHQVHPAIGYYHHVRRGEAPRPIAVDFVLRADQPDDYDNLLHNLRSLGYPSAGRVRVLQVGRSLRWRLALLRARCQRHVPWLVVDAAEVGAAASEVPPGAYAKAIVGCAQRMGPAWLWDALGTLELDADTAIVTGPIVDASERIRSVGYVAGLDGFFGTPLPGERLPAVPLALLRRHVTAAHAGLLVLRAGACAAVGPLEGVDDDDALNGIEFCLRAAAHGMRTAYTPRVKAMRARALLRPVGSSDPARRVRIAERYGSQLADDPYYARYLVRESSRYAHLDPAACT